MDNKKEFQNEKLVVEFQKDAKILMDYFQRISTKYKNEIEGIIIWRMENACWMVQLQKSENVEMSHIEFNAVTKLLIDKLSVFSSKYKSKIAGFVISYDIHTGYKINISRDPSKFR